MCALLALAIQSSHAGATSAQSYLGQKLPGDEPELFAPGIVSTGREHSAAMFTPDGTEIYFGRLFPAAIYVMKKQNDRWLEPQVVAFSGTHGDLYPLLARDGNEIFFTSERPIKKGGDRLGRGQGHIWKVERTSEGWSQARHLGPEINHSRLQSCGSIAANGNIYFAANQSGRSMEIFRSQLVDGTYARPENLTGLNSPTPDHSPFVAADESFVIFSSFRGGHGRSDLFISFRRRDDSWRTPRNLGPRINSAFKDEYPYLTPDGRFLIFNSNRPSMLNAKPIPDGPGNVYWMDAAFIEEIRQVELKQGH
jgi:hypothetical protein